jgi:predicted aspartyl protease
MLDASRAVLNRREILAIASSLIGVGCCASRARARHATTGPIVYDEHGGLMVKAIISRESVHMILDTGASRSAIDLAFAHKLALPLRDGGEVEGSAGVVRSQAADLDIEVPPFPSARLACTVYDIGSYDPRCVGILGADFLAQAPFQIFYRERTWSRGGELHGERIAMTLDNNIPRIQARIDGVPIDLRIDTGATFPPGDDAYLNVTTAQAELLHLSGPPQAVFSATGAGGEKLKLSVYALKSLEVGSKRIDRAFAIVQPRVGYFARDDAVGFLGNSALDKLDPGLDYESRVLTIGS